MVTSEPDNEKNILISYGGISTTVAILFEERNRLRITVQPDKSVIVKAPKNHNLDSVLAKLKHRANWIFQQLNYFDQYHPTMPERKYVSGETYYYLGRQYRLRVFDGIRNEVKLIGRFFILNTTRPDDRLVKKKLMEKWYSDHATRLIQKRVAIYIERLKEYGAKEPEIRFRKMEKRWGSCTPGGKITFNTELIKAPIHCIDYVVVHELCHLVVEEHNGKFYRLLDLIMPDWKKRKERLEKVILI